MLSLGEKTRLKMALRMFDKAYNTLWAKYDYLTRAEKRYSDDRIKCHRERSHGSAR